MHVFSHGLQRGQVKRHGFILGGAAGLALSRLRLGRPRPIIYYLSPSTFHLFPIINNYHLLPITYDLSLF